MANTRKNRLPLIGSKSSTGSTHSLATNIGPKVCHPKLGRSITCLPDSEMKIIGGSLGAPPELHGVRLRNWMTRKTRCKTERCLLERSRIDVNKKAALLKEYFRPTKPDSWVSDPDEWLDSTNIKDVMKQYEEAYPEFKFYGTNPIDFGSPDPYDKDALSKKKCLNDDICKLDLKRLLSQGKTKLGFVYNLDPSNKGGSHWIASFTDIPAHRTYYFDSYGMKPPPEIARFMRSLTLQDPLMKLRFNARRFQYSNTECGMFSMYFLIRMLKGDSFKDFTRSVPPTDTSKSYDEYMIRLRNELFLKKDE
jgi:hypothetical protein